MLLFFIRNAKKKNHHSPNSPELRHLAQTQSLGHYTHFTLNPSKHLATQQICVSTRAKGHSGRTGQAYPKLQSGAEKSKGTPWHFSCRGRRKDSKSTKQFPQKSERFPPRPETRFKGRYTLNRTQDKDIVGRLIKRVSGGFLDISTVPLKRFLL